MNFFVVVGAVLTVIVIAGYAILTRNEGEKREEKKPEEQKSAEQSEPSPDQPSIE